MNGVADFLNTYTYDVLGQLTTLTQEGVAGGHTVAPKRVDFAYNKVGQFSQISRSADLAGSLPVADSGYSYNASGDLIGLSYGQPMGPNHTNPASLAGYSWTYDDAGRITGFSSPDGMTNYSYDATGQLQTATHNPLVQGNETYSYDKNGNRTMPGYQTLANNRLVSDGTSTYEYDAEGHRTKQTEISTGNYVTYDWDYRSRLIGVTSHTSNGTVTKQVRYTYDAFDRRIVKEVDSEGNGTYEKAEAYVYDGSDIVLVADGAGSLTNRYLHGPAVDQILADEQISSDSQIPSTVLWAFADNQGTVRDWAQRNSSTGETKIVDHLVYDAYGQIIAHTNPQPGQTTIHEIRYAYTGREWDADAGLAALDGLYYYRARWYDAHAGRFISEDPLGFAAGDTNVQRYVGNNATNYIDPSGLEDAPLGSVLGVAISGAVLGPSAVPPVYIPAPTSLTSVPDPANRLQSLLEMDQNGSRLSVHPTNACSDLCIASNLSLKNFRSRYP